MPTSPYGVRCSDAGLAHVHELCLDDRMSAADCAAVVSSAVERGRPTRTTATRSRHAVVGSFPSHKMRAAFATESSVEASVLMLADVLERVRAYRPQALRVRFMHEGRLRSAYPDLLLVRHDGVPEVWECKPNRGVTAVAFHRLISLRTALRAVGIDYRVQQPHWSRRAPLASNAALLWHHAATQVPDAAAAMVSGAVDAGAAILSDLGRKCGVSLPMLLAMAARGVFAVDIGTMRLGAASPVRRVLPGATSGAFDGTADGSPSDVSGAAEPGHIRRS